MLTNKQNIIACCDNEKIRTVYPAPGVLAAQKLTQLINLLMALHASHA
jgi:hypothetical protein